MSLPMATRYTHLATQATYRRAIAAHGLRALLAPYTLTPPVIPVQRRPLSERVAA